MRRLSPQSRQLDSMRQIAALQPYFDALALQVRTWAGKRDRVVALGVMGTVPGVGASTVAFHLACALAESSFSGEVLLVGAEDESSGQRGKQPGLVEVLSCDKKLNDCLIRGTHENLQLLPMGSLERGKEREKPWTKVSDLLQHEFTQFDFVVFDLLPFSQSKVSGPIGSQLNGMLLVCGPEAGQGKEISEVRRFLRDFPVEVLGKVINRTVESSGAR